MPSTHLYDTVTMTTVSHDKLFVQRVLITFLSQFFHYRYTRNRNENKESSDSEQYHENIHHQVQHVVTIK